MSNQLNNRSKLKLLSNNVSHPHGYKFMGEQKMENNKNTKHELFHEYYARWINIYKEGAIRRVTMQKYKMTQQWLVKLIPNLEVCS